jgi:hypothetical protein
MKLRRSTVRREKSTDDFQERQRNAGATGALDFHSEQSGADLQKIGSSGNSSSKRFCGRLFEINHLVTARSLSSAFLFVPLEYQGCLSGQPVGIAAWPSTGAHCLRVSATLDDAVCDPNLQFVVKAVPDAAESDLISTPPGHDLSIPCNRSPCI